MNAAAPLSCKVSIAFFTAPVKKRVFIGIQNCCNVRESASISMWNPHANHHSDVIRKLHGLTGGILIEGGEPNVAQLKRG